MMIDTRTFEKYKFELEQAVRDYTKAKNEIQQIKEAAINQIREVGTDGLETKQILDEMLAETTDREDTMRWAQDEFRKTKDKMIAMISRIELPRSY
jgi:predicted transcriptional regulator